MDDLPNVIVSFDWLREHHDDVHIVDVREPWEYEDIGHIPGAINIPFEQIRIKGTEDAGLLPGATEFMRIMKRNGIDSATPIIAYDDENGVFAARFVVTALLYNHKLTALLNGDYSAWAREYETTTDIPTAEPSMYPIRLAKNRPLVGADDVKAAATDEESVLVDTRTEAEFNVGHIEGAVHFDWREVVDRDSRQLKPDEEIREILESHGISPDKRVVLYCNTARRISHTFIVLRYLGYPDVLFYEGSLLDWKDKELALHSVN